MILVGSGLCLRAYDARGGSAKLRVVICGCDLRFSDRLQGWIDHDPAEHGIVIVRAVQKVRCTGEALTVYQHSIGTLRILGRGGGQAGGLRHDTRSEKLE